MVLTGIIQRDSTTAQASKTDILHVFTWCVYLLENNRLIGNYLKISVCMKAALLICLGKLLLGIALISSCEKQKKLNMHDLLELFTFIYYSESEKLFKATLQ